jgi:hypothetical protein
LCSARREAGDAGLVGHEHAVDSREEVDDHR